MHGYRIAIAVGAALSLTLGILVIVTTDFSLAPEAFMPPRRLTTRGHRCAVRARGWPPSAARASAIGVAAPDADRAGAASEARPPVSGVAEPTGARLTRRRRGRHLRRSGVR